MLSFRVVNKPKGKKRLSRAPKFYHLFELTFFSELFTSIRLAINCISTWNMYPAGPFISFYKNMVHLEKQRSVVILNKSYQGLHIYMLKTQCIGNYVLWLDHFRKISFF